MKCFVIGPFGELGSETRESSDALYEMVIEPTAKEEGYDPGRTIDSNKPGCIVDSIMEGLLTADLVVADLTGDNPNVFYELAVRHATARPVIHLTTKATSTRIPFDISTMSIIQIKKDENGRWIDKAKLDLATQIRHFKNMSGVKGQVSVPNQVYSGFKRYRSPLSETTISYDWIIDYSNDLSVEWLKRQKRYVGTMIKKHLKDNSCIPEKQSDINLLGEYLAYTKYNGSRLGGFLYYDREKIVHKTSSINFSGYGIFPTSTGPICAKIIGAEKNNDSMILEFYQNPSQWDIICGVEKEKVVKADIPPFEYTIVFSQDEPGSIRLCGTLIHPNHEGLAVGETYITKR